MAGNHAKKGPSGAERLHACPGALALISTVPEAERRGSNPASQLGTAAHFLLEKCLTEHRPPSAFSDRVIVLLGDHEDGSMLKPKAKLPGKGTVYFIVDDDMVRGVTMAYDYVLLRLSEYDPRDVTLLLEKKTNPVPDRDDTWGTADVTIDVFLTMLEVVDYKNGFNVVEHRNNPQLLSYLAGRAHDTGWSHDAYRITVVQPWADHDDGRIRSFDVSREDLLAFVDRHRAAAALADEAADVLQDMCLGDPKRSLDRDDVRTWSEVYLRAGEQCDYCDASMICPAKKLWLESKARIKFDEDPPPDQPVSLSLVEASKVLAWSPYLLSHIKEARGVEFRAIQAGVALPNRKIVRQKPRGRKFVEGLGTSYEIASALVKGGFISDNQRTLLFTEPELLSGPKIEKLIPTTKVELPDGSKSTLRKQFAERFLYMPEGRLVSAPLDDPRDAVEVSPGAAFDDLETEDDDAQ